MRADDPRPRRGHPDWLVGGAVERRRWDDAEVERFLARGVPLVLTGGCPLSDGLVGRWSFEHLRGLFTGEERLQVHHAPRDTNCFNRFYGIGLGSGGVRLRSFAQFVDAAAGVSEARHYLVSPLVLPDGGSALEAEVYGQDALDGDDEPRDGAAAVGASAQCLGMHGDRMAAELRDRIGWRWLADTQVHTEAAGPLSCCQLWAGHGCGGHTPTHFDALNNFLCQLAGEKHVLLFPPSASWHLYPFPNGEHPMDNFAMVDVTAPDLERFPAAARARGLSADLLPGDVLWLPRFWWHFVAQAGPQEGRPQQGRPPGENLSLNFWMGRKGTGAFRAAMRSSVAPPPAEVDAAARRSAEDEAACREADAREALARRDDAALQSADGLSCLLLARRFEGSLTELLGSARAAGELLTDMAAGAELRWGEATPMRRHARHARAEMMGMLGGELTNALLRAMARDGRLHPGLAPEIVGPTVNSEAGELSTEDKGF